VAKLVWDAVGARRFETGVSQGVLYLSDGRGVPWNGLISVAEISTGKTVDPLYFDGKKYMDYAFPGEVGVNIRAYTYPDEFLEYEGYATAGNGLILDSQYQKTFGLSYKTIVGNDVTGIDYGYKIHIFYGLTAIAEDPEYSSLNDETEPVEFSWTATSRPQTVSGYRPTSHVIIDSRRIDSTILTNIQDILYGATSSISRLPTVSELLTLTSAGLTFVITDNGDGTWTATVPDANLTMNGATEFTITSSNAVFLDSPADTTYTISSS
jgi:hypothetical protein